MNFHGASLQHQSYSNFLAAAAESGHDLRLSYDRDSPEQKIDPRQAGERTLHLFSPGRSVASTG
jgi:hypothetical protein